jgi:hypothetical protein
MTLPELERNLVGTLGLAIVAGLEDPERSAELGGNAVLLLGLLREAGGLEKLVARCRERGGWPEERGGAAG